jgi:glycosyltransferase involved in cell wall biosynthesis
MKVLLLSLFHPELVRGGAQQICYELFEGLKEGGEAEPVLLGAVDQSFASLYKSGACITGFDRRENEYIFLSAGYDYLWNKLNNDRLVGAFEDFLTETQPDVVHFHHFLLFGIDLITLTRRVLPNVRIIFTFHEFLTICMAYGQMVRTTDKSLCDKPSQIRCHQCFPEHGPEFFFMKEMWAKRHLESVDVFTTPARFMIDLYVNWGIDPAKITHVTNGQRDYGLSRLPDPPREKRNRFGFFGQFVDNKGVWVILEAVALLRAEGFTDFVVELNGDNLRYASEERRTEIESFLEREKALPPDERIVRFNGSYEVGRLPTLMARVDWCIVASVWREAFGLVISEAWMFGRPVICSNIGAMAERVRDEENGLHFAVGDPRSLAEVIKRASTEDGLWDKIVSTITPPPSRDEMVDGYMRLYRDGLPAVAPAPGPALAVDAA